MKAIVAVAVCALGVTFTGCKKNNEEAKSSAATTGRAASETPAATATGPSQPASAGSPTVANQAAAVDETIAKLTGIAWATKQDEIKNDPNGQWAVDAKASSTYNDAKDKDSWSALQATGEPDVPKYADDGHAWTSKEQEAGIEWLDLKFAKPVNATEVRVRESYSSGAIAKLDLFDEQGTSHTIWQGIDPTKELNYFVVKFPKTDYKVNRVKITLATNIIPGWKEIDAVQLVGTDSK